MCVKVRLELILFFYAPTPLSPNDAVTGGGGYITGLGYMDMPDADFLCLCFVPQYVVECHAQTLLPQYLGMYRLTVNDAETYMVVMRNVFSPRLTIHKKYDLKVWYKQSFPLDLYKTNS